MTAVWTVTVSCSLCGDEIEKFEAKMVAADQAPPLPKMPFAVGYSGRLNELCDACMEPVMDAISERIVLLKGEGRYRG